MAFKEKLQNSVFKNRQLYLFAMYFGPHIQKKLRPDNVTPPTLNKTYIHLKKIKSFIHDNIS